MYSSSQQYRPTSGRVRTVTAGMLGAALLICLAAGCGRDRAESPPDASRSSATAPPAPPPRPLSVHEAAEADDTDALAKQLGTLKDINAPDAAGLSPLQHAAWAGSPRALKVLIERGAALDATDPLGRSIVDLAVDSGNAETVALLLDKAPAPDLGAALRRAAGGGASQLVALLLKRGAKVDAADPRGLTALHVAALRDRADVLEQLLAQGASVDAGNEAGNTALHLAVMADHAAAVALLAARTTAIEQANKLGYTPLQLAAALAGPEVAQALLDRGAKPDAPGPHGTAIDIAIVQGNEPVEALLDPAAAGAAAAAP